MDVIITLTILKLCGVLLLSWGWIFGIAIGFIALAIMLED